MSTAVKLALNICDYFRLYVQIESEHVYIIEPSLNPGFGGAHLLECRRSCSVAAIRRALRRGACVGARAETPLFSFCDLPKCDSASAAA
ncbi:MAG: hypothetical protein V4567_09060 [Pseudomonadota bacterium]